MWNHEIWSRTPSRKDVSRHVSLLFIMKCKGSRFYHSDCVLVVDVCLHWVDEDVSGRTFEEWDPSTDTDPSEAPVAMIVNSSQLCVTIFDLREVIPLQLETVTRGDDVREVRPSNRFTTWVPGGMYSPWITTMSSGHDVSEYELGTSGLPPMFHHNNNNRAKIDENPRKIMIFAKKNS